MDISDSTRRLIQRLGPKTGIFEHVTAQLWINLLHSMFPINTGDNFLYAPEFSHTDGRCDLVILQSKAEFRLPGTAASVPFLAVEFKSGNAPTKDWDECVKQLRTTMFHIEKWLNYGQWISGFVAAGTEFQFFCIDDENSTGMAVLNLHGQHVLQGPKLNLYDAGTNGISQEALFELSKYLVFVRTELETRAHVFQSGA